MMLKTALHFGHAVSGKSKEQFANDARPYLKVKGEYTLLHLSKLPHF